MSLGPVGKQAHRLAGPLPRELGVLIGIVRLNRGENDKYTWASECGASSAGWAAAYLPRRRSFWLASICVDAFGGWHLGVAGAG